MTLLGLCFDSSAHGVLSSHEPALVALSFAIALLASFTALETVERLRAAPGPARHFWRLAAALSLGGGVWSMHFVAMLAYRLPMAQAYDPVQTLASALIAIVAVGAGLTLIERTGGAARLAAAGVLVGLGVAAMHYCGMGALRISAQVYYRLDLFLLSVMIAIAAATAALWLSTTVRSLRQRAMAAVVMAGAICGMHFTGMAATIVVAGGQFLPPPHDAVRAAVLAWAVAISVTMILLVALASAVVDRRLKRETAIADHLRQLNAALAERSEMLTLALAQVDEARRAAEAANAAKSVFLSSMSHEFRTPLNVILGFADLLRLNACREPLTRRQEEAVEHILGSGHHLLGLIKSVLDLVRLGGEPTGAVASEAVSVVVLMRQLDARFAPDAQLAGVQPHWDFEGAAGLSILADTARASQALACLISNAIKYNRPGGSFDVRAVLEAGRVAVSVRDTGVGIPPARAAGLFEPFNRLGHEGSAILGAGVGLAVARRLVESMDGELAFESALGVGSTFTIRLPAAGLDDGALATAPPSALIPAHGRRDQDLRSVHS